MQRKEVNELIKLILDNFSGGGVTVRQEEDNEGNSRIIISINVDN